LPFCGLTPAAICCRRFAAKTAQLQNLCLELQLQPPEKSQYRLVKLVNVHRIISRLSRKSRLG
jgi:hypothetical protein